MTCFPSHLRSCAYCFLCLGLKLRIHYTKQWIQQWFSICLFGGELHPKPSLDQWLRLQSSTWQGIFFVPVSLQKANSSHQFLFLDLESSRACDVSLLLLSYPWWFILLSSLTGLFWLSLLMLFNICYWFFLWAHESLNLQCHLDCKSLNTLLKPNTSYPLYTRKRYDEKNKTH